MIKPLPLRLENADATGYVCTLPEEGLAQLEILKKLGCQPHHKVLEIGCGALVAGFPIMQYLDAKNYAGVEPNAWLFEASLKIPEVEIVAAAKRPAFFPVSNFRTGEKFDFIISHSILSHASDAQLTDFLAAAAEQLNEGGTLAASIRLAEGNDVGSPGSARHGAAFTEWQYPGVSWFKKADVVERARRARLSVVVAPEIQQLLLAGNPKAIHDWVVVQRNKVTLVTAFFRLADRAVDEDEQFRQFERLAACGMPILLFLDERLIDRSPKHENVRVIPTNLESLWAFKWASGRILNLPSNRTPEKDTRDFLLLQNSKLDLLEMALQREDFSSHFAWIDFGIMKIVQEPELFLKRLQTLAPPASCVLAPGCWDLENQRAENTVNWRFCGGFLLADRASIPGLVERHHVVLQQQGRLTWEVNVWAAMERTGQHFDWYKADHDDSIIDWEPNMPPAAAIYAGVPRVCLTMIVKNEGAIIERCLTAALPYIDTWCITDTGSTDGTSEKIEQFFTARRIPGRLARAEFRNFAQARNDSLAAARGFEGWEYALLIDADMMLEGTLNKSELRAPAYGVMQNDGFIRYSNTRLVRRDAPATYFGFTHEYLSVEGVEQLSGFTVNDRNDGGSKSDKGYRDIRLLNEQLVAEPNNGRALFYLAQTHRGMDRPHRAIPLYRKRIEVGGWDEEIWASHYGLAHAYKDLGDEANFIRSCLDAYNCRPFRGESLKLLAQYFREKGINEPAFLFAEGLQKLPYTGDLLFVESGVYDFGALQEIEIAGYWSKLPERRDAGYRACVNLTVHPNESIRSEARKNFTHYVKSVKELFGAEVKEIDWKPSDGWAPMNPSVYIDEDGKRLVLVRTVNYKVADGQYPTIDNSGVIRTKNYVLEMNSDWRPMIAVLIEDATGRPRSNFPVEGFEDCRLWESDSSFYVSATVRDSAESDGRCEIAIVRLTDQWIASGFSAIRDYERDKTQKNWMPIVGKPGAFLYTCDPTIAIDAFIADQGTTELARHPSPACLVDLRGGSQLIPHHDGWLCITHEVAWRPERVYLHRFVRFDAEFRIIALSDPFYFLKVGIEFCAGLARDGDKLIASFGLNDASAHLAFLETESVDRALFSLEKPGSCELKATKSG